MASKRVAMKPVAMKPVKAWAVVYRDGFTLCARRADLPRFDPRYARVVRVEIREVPKRKRGV